MSDHDNRGNGDPRVLVLYTCTSEGPGLILSQCFVSMQLGN